MDRFIAPDARIIDADVDYAALAAQDPVWAPPPQRQLRASRRQFIKGVIASGTAVSALSYTMGVRSARAQGPAPERLISINVNGQVRRADVTANETLAMTLRYKLGLTGTKLGCDRGECGACTVLIDDVPHHSCSTLSHSLRGRKVTTIEGLEGPNGELHPRRRSSRSSRPNVASVRPAKSCRRWRCSRSIQNRRGTKPARRCPAISAAAAPMIIISMR